MRGKERSIKWMKRMLWCVCFMAVMCGCGKNVPPAGDGGEETGKTDMASRQEDAAGKGRFLESELPLPEHTEKVMAAAKLEDGNIEMFLWNKEKKAYEIYLSENGGEQFDLKEQYLGNEENNRLDGYVSNVAIRADGTVAGIHKNDEGVQIFTILPEGTMETAPLSLPDLEQQKEEYADNIIDVAFDKEGSFLIENLNSHFYKADLATGACELFCELEEHYVRYFGMAGNQLLAVSEDGVFSFDSISGEVLEEDALWKDLMAKTPSLAEKYSEYGEPLAFAEGMEENTVFYVSHEGVFCHVNGGSVSEQLINGSLNSLGDVKTNFLQLLVLDKENFLVFVNAASGSKLLKYSYDKDASSMPETELSVYALEDSDFLRQVVSIYQKNHQDVYVNLQIGMSGEDGITAEDAIRTLNTDILSGNGPDVMILDGLPVDKYMEKGMLMDLAPIIEEVEASDGIFENIKEAYETEGAIYQFPAKFYVNLVDGDVEGVEAGAALDQLAAYVSAKREAGETGIFPFRGAENLLEKLYLANSACWMDGDGTLKEAELTKFLTSAKQIYDAEPKELEDVYWGVEDLGLTGSVGSMGILLKEEKISYGTLVSMTQLITMMSANRQLGLDYALADRNAEKAFVPYQLAGISATTGKDGAAKDFLKTLFGMECNSLDGSGFPVNRAAYETICEQAKNKFDEFNQGGVAVSTDEGESVDLDLKNLTEDDIVKLTGILEEVRKPVCMDRVVKELVLAQGEAVLFGNSSVEDAVAEILRKGNLYLSE